MYSLYEVHEVAMFLHLPKPLQSFLPRNSRQCVRTSNAAGAISNDHRLTDCSAAAAAAAPQLGSVDTVQLAWAHDSPRVRGRIENEKLELNPGLRKSHLIHWFLWTIRTQTMIPYDGSLFFLIQQRFYQFPLLRFVCETTSHDVGIKHWRALQCSKNLMYIFFKKSLSDFQRYALIIVSFELRLLFQNTHTKRSLKNK